MEMGLADSASKYYLEEVELDMPEGALNALKLNGVLGAEVDVRIAAHEPVASMLRAHNMRDRLDSSRKL